MSLTWTFNTYAFYFMKAGESGAPTNPDWQQPPRLVKRPLLGTKRTDIVRVGFESLVITSGVWVPIANVTALRTLNGTIGTLSNGIGGQWSCVMEITISPVVSGGFYVGTATFTRLSG